MNEENNNNTKEQQAKIEERRKVMTIYNKIIAIADKITDDYNDDSNVTPNHELLANRSLPAPYGVFADR